jgi:asparagine synthase (glutamine-hydrolysing)
VEPDIDDRMCGLVGCFGFRRLSDREIGATIGLNRLMERRGPDDDGVWHDRHSCVLGFRRLAILDLSAAAHQPMTSSDGRFVIVYNGEVYNFPELRDHLCQKGVRFRSSGDSEVVLQMLIFYGREGLDRLNGMFALALYDRRERRLLLARDHAGIKPLYYLATPAGLVFASQYDQLLAHPWSNKLAISREGLGLYLRLGYIPAPNALLEHTHLLEPGSWLEASVTGQVTSGRFFEFPCFGEPDLSGAEAVEAVDQAITGAVRRQLVSDVPIGTFLSGGIDSPLVAAKAAAASNGAVRAFTVATGDELDESKDAVAYAEELGLEHVIEPATPEAALGMLEDVVGGCGEPFADYSIFPTMLIARLARRHVKVMLSGDGGDELFWGYPSRFVSPVRYAADFRKPQWLRTLHWGFNRVLADGDRRYDLLYSSVGALQRTAHVRIGEPELRDIFAEPPPPWPEAYSVFEYRGYEPDRIAQWLRWNEFVSHLTMVLLKVDRATMHHSLEVRVPLLDREVVAVASRVDWRSCLDLARGVGKLPLRSALARHVSGQTQFKRGFEVPMRAWLRGPLGDVFQEAVIDPGEILGMKANRRALQTMLRQHRAGDGDHTRSLWTLLSLSLWERRHYRTRSSLPPESLDRAMSAPVKAQAL